jgi:hypothetical protein
MSSQIKPVLVQDPLLALDDKMAYAVYRGGANVSTQQFNATSQSSTSHVYNIQVPSTSIVMSRQLIWGSDITFTVEGVPIAGKFLVNYGTDTILAPFVLNQLCSNMNCQINNTTVQLPVNQVLDPLLRSIDKANIDRWNSSTPTQLDYFGLYSQFGDATFPNQVASPFNGAFQILDRSSPPRGAFPVSIVDFTTGVAPTTASTKLLITVRVAEPIFVSPFIFGDGEGQSGLTGLTQININCQMDALGSRALRWIAAVGYAPKSITAVNYANSYIECKFLSPKPSDLIPQTTITPLATYTNYILPATSSVASTDLATKTLTSNAIMLNSYPDKVFIFVRDAQRNLKPENADVYCAIEGVSITLGAQSGLLSNFRNVDLYRASYEAGSQQTWFEFTGIASANSDGSSIGIRAIMSGSVLCLDFGQTINIPEDYFAPGSLSTTQFQVTVRYSNTTGIGINPELNCMFMNSGILSTSNGSSSAYTSGVLSKQVVLDANLGEPVKPMELNRLVGGAGLFNGFKAFASKMLPRLPSVAKHILGAVDHPVAGETAKVLGHMGYGEGEMEGEARRRMGRKNVLKHRLL